MLLEIELICKVENTRWTEPLDPCYPLHRGGEVGAAVLCRNYYVNLENDKKNFCLG